MVGLWTKEASSGDGGGIKAVDTVERGRRHTSSCSYGSPDKHSALANKHWLTSNGKRSMTVKMPRESGLPYARFTNAIVELLTWGREQRVHVRPALLCWTDDRVVNEGISLVHNTLLALVRFLHSLWCSLGLQVFAARQSLVSLRRFSIFCSLDNSCLE